jgi:putative lipoic acid-binding regulatory protein
MSKKTKDYSKLKELLEDQEEFPIYFVYKFIGRNTTVFATAVEGLLKQFPSLKHEMTRKTANDQHIAMTYGYDATSADAVIEVFRHIEKIDDLILIL